jgi:hypothetical protein
MSSAYLDGIGWMKNKEHGKKGWNVGALKAIARVTLPSISSFPLPVALQLLLEQEIRGDVFMTRR